MITEIGLEKVEPGDKKRREVWRRLLGGAQLKPYSVVGWNGNGKSEEIFID